MQGTASVGDWRVYACCLLFATQLACVSAAESSVDQQDLNPHGQNLGRAAGAFVVMAYIAFIFAVFRFLIKDTEDDARLDCAAGCAFVFGLLAVIMFFAYLGVRVPEWETEDPTCAPPSPAFTEHEPHSRPLFIALIVMGLIGCIMFVGCAAFQELKAVGFGCCLAGSVWLIMFFIYLGIMMPYWEGTNLNTGSMLAAIISLFVCCGCCAAGGFYAGEGAMKMGGGCAAFMVVIGFALTFLYIGGEIGKDAPLELSTTTTTSLPFDSDTTCKVDAMLHVFFNRDCLLTMGKEQGEDSIRDVNQFIESVVSPVRFENQLISLLSFLGGILLMQLGGIPKPENMFGRILWGTWMTIMALQWLATLLSMAMLIFSTFLIGTKYGGCAVRWHCGMPMITLVGMITAVFQPSFFPFAALQTLYFQALTVGIKALDTQIDSENDEESLPTGKWKNRMDAIVFPFYMFTWVAVPCVVCALGWLMSASILFAIIYLPLSLIAGIEIVAVFGFARIPLWFVNQYGMSAHDIEKYDTERRNKKLDPDFKVTERSWLDKMNLWISKTIRDGLWWMTYIAGGGSHRNPFLATISTTLILYAIAPLIVYGTFLAIYVYNGGTTEQHTEFIGWSYEYTFCAFTNVEFELPVFGFVFDLSIATQALGYIGDLLSRAKKDPAYYLQGSTAVAGLNFLLSIIKPLTTICPRVLGGVIKFSTKFNAFQLEEIPFSNLAKGEFYKFQLPAFRSKDGKKKGAKDPAADEAAAGAAEAASEEGADDDCDGSQAAAGHAAKKAGEGKEQSDAGKVEALADAAAAPAQISDAAEAASGDGSKAAAKDAAKNSDDGKDEGDVVAAAEEVAADIVLTVEENHETHIFSL